MALFKIIASFVQNKHGNTNSSQFLIDIKELILQNLKKYKSTVDVMNFQEIFEEVLQD
jgi:hypothetical protein